MMKVTKKRTWCFASYISVISIWDSATTIFHIIVPFVMNFASAIIIIKTCTRQRAVIKKQEKYQNILIEQLKQHKVLLIGPTVLAILAVPRFIIALTSGCMKSAHDSWLFLVGYFISLISTFTDIHFVCFTIICILRRISQSYWKISKPTTNSFIKFQKKRFYY